MYASSFGEDLAKQIVKRIEFSSRFFQRQNSCYEDVARGL